ncbi:MAG: alpha/beta hydrolase [Calditrichaceae bacterium]|nr:alpha/beta hydrolase [Calditrichaceae bacterium]MBN2708153.1 alpha/beta hydrolase [Calditrichaceae bacterium]RQV94829.1 MAG: alpha/beta hydrolase [Calditrichota bacterium]
MKLVKYSLITLMIFSFSINAQEIINLYQGAVPNSINSKVEEKAHSGMFSGVTIPTLEMYLPENEKSAGAAVIICPGGGYSVVVYQAEGIQAAKEFAKNGVTAFVLKYRLPDDSTMTDKKIGPLQDALQAIKIVRENASKWRIDVNKIGIMGFSAGGHLASTAATHFDKAVIENSNKTNLRPDFLILIYPVISMRDSLTHPDSRNKLLGKNPSKEIIELFSNELQVDADTPPAYITHAGDDKLVDADNSIIFYEELKRHNIPAELHIYPRGNHGFVLRQKTENWIAPIINWMKSSDWYNKNK